MKEYSINKKITWRGAYKEDDDSDNTVEEEKEEKLFSCTYWWFGFRKLIK